MNRILLKNVILDNQTTDVVIEGNRFAQIGGNVTGEFNETINGKGNLALLPPFYNTHTHIAMTLLRGYADDLELFDWLNNHIWPAEAKLTPEDIYYGTRLGLLEMIHSGSVFCCDSYPKQELMAKAADEMKMRAAICYLYFCPGGLETNTNQLSNDRLRENAAALSDRIILPHFPHAIYTVSETALCQIAEQHAGEFISVHASETKGEFDDCLKKHGMTPVAFLEKCGLLGPKTVLAHCVHLTDDDLNIIARTQSVISHNPTSNLKLCSGRFRWEDALATGCRVTIGTDGPSSNNNLSMLEEIKFAAISAKVEAGRPTAGRAEQVFRAATVEGAHAFGLDAGEIAVGKLADCQLVDLDNPVMTGDFNLISNIVYSADSSVVNTVICDGNILMRDHYVPGQEEIVRQARNVCRKLRQA